MTLVTNSAEGGSNGTTVTIANSGGTSGTAFDTVTIDAGNSLTFDSAHARASLAYKFTTTSPAGNVRLQWQGALTGAPYNKVWMRAYVYLTAYPSSVLKALRATSSGTVRGSIGIDSSGHIVLQDAGGTTQKTSTTVVPLNQWFRIEGYVTGSTTAGQIEAKIYSTEPDEIFEDETLTTVNTLNTGGMINRIDFGNAGNVASYTFWLDNLGVSSTGYIGGVPTLTAVQDSAWPPRIILSAENLAIGDEVDLYRVIAGQRTLVRGANSVILTDPSFVVYDGEYPFGIPISYVVRANEKDVATSSTVSYSLPGGKVALSDAITGLSVEAVITAWAEKQADRASTTFTVGGRKVVVSAPRGASESQVEFLTEESSTREQMLALLDGCTSGIILIRQPGGYDGVDGTYFVMSDTEARAAQNGLLARRLFTLDLVESSGWAADLLNAGWTYADVDAAYTGLTYADLDSGFTTYLEITVYDWGLF